MIVYHIAIFACFLVGGGAFDSEMIPYLILSSSACGRGRELGLSVFCGFVFFTSGVMENSLSADLLPSKHHYVIISGRFGMSSEWILHGSQ